MQQLQQLTTELVDYCERCNFVHMFTLTRETETVTLYTGEICETEVVY